MAPSSGSGKVRRKIGERADVTYTIQRETDFADDAATERLQETNFAADGEVFAAATEPEEAAAEPEESAAEHKEAAPVSAAAAEPEEAAAEPEESAAEHKEAAPVSAAAAEPEEAAAEPEESAAEHKEAAPVSDAAAVSIPMAASSASAGSEEKWQTSPAQSLQQNEIGRRPSITYETLMERRRRAKMRHEEMRQMAGAPASVIEAGLAVVAVAVAVAVSIFLLVRYHGNPMFQVWILSASIYSCVFFFLRIWRTRWFCIDLVRLTNVPLLAFSSATAMGSATATFVLFFGMVWAAGNLGYSVAVHRLRNGTASIYPPVPSIHLTFRVKGIAPDLGLPCPPKDSVKEFNFCRYIVAPFVLLLSTLFMALVVNIPTQFDELDILMTLSYFGWIHVTAWIIFVAMNPMHQYPIEKLMPSLVPALVLWMLVSPVICFVSQILSVLCHLLLLMALVAFLWYNLGLYIHFLATAKPSDILVDKIGQVKSDPRLGETSSEAAATLLLSS